MPESNFCEKSCWRPRLVVTNVWQTCEKVRAAVFRGGLDLWSYFRPLDPNNSSLVSEAQFVSVIAGPLRESLGLTDNEIAQLADFFRLYDGRIYYSQFCDIIHSNLPNVCQNPPLVTGLETKLTCETKQLNCIEESRISMLLTKIATLVNRRNLILRPYFQDYELISKTAGAITRNHFARVLSYLNICVSAEEFLLLIKKFGRDSYTVDYVNFITALDRVISALREQGVVDVGGDVLPQFPNRALCAPLPVLPRPELTADCPKPARPSVLCDTLRRIQCFVLKNRINVDAFFKSFDTLDCGRVFEEQFRRCLDKFTAYAPQRYCISKEETDRLVAAYRAPNDPDRICYSLFEEDLNRILTPADILLCSKQVNLTISQPETKKSDASHIAPKQSVSDCEKTIAKIQERVNKRRVNMKPAFIQNDPKDCGHVTNHEMRHVFMTLGMLLTSIELNILEARFCDEMGFNYRWFLSEVESYEPGDAMTEKYVEEELVKDRKPFPFPSPTIAERDIVEILANIKGKIVRDSICVRSCLKVMDPSGEGTLPRACFCLGLRECGFGLTATEMETVMDAFGPPGRPDRVDYNRFADTINKSLKQPCLERAPMIAPLEQIPRPVDCRNFLNFEERYRAGRAMQKLCDRPLDAELEAAFRQHDHCRTGLVTPQQFRCVMHRHGLYHLFSTPEVEAMVKCFGVRRGQGDDIDYRAFCHAINILQVNRRRRVL